VEKFFAVKSLNAFLKTKKMYLIFVFNPVSALRWLQKTKICAVIIFGKFSSKFRANNA